MRVPTRWPSSSLGCILSGLAFHAAVLAVLLALWLVIGLPYGSHRVRMAEQAWTQVSLSEKDFAKRYPPKRHTPAALRLDAVARRLGSVLAMTPEDNREHRPKRDPNLKLLSDFITSVREQGDDGTPNMPPSVPRISGAQAADMAEFEQVLLDEEPVDWRSSEGSEISVSLLGFRYLHEALLVRSLLADQRGDRIARDRAIDAAWLLEESMQRRPVVIDRLLVYVAASSRNACLRRFRSGPADWASRIRPEERLLSLVDCFQNEALVVCRSSHRLMGLADANSLFGDKLPRVGPGGWVLRVATAPLLRLGVASYANLLRLETEALRRGNPCTIDREAYDEGVTSSLPRWNVVARAAAPLLAAWWTARDAALNDELTLAVLAQRDTGAGPGWTRASSVCQGLSWRSDPSPRGGVTVRAIGDRTAELDASKPGLSYALTGR